MPTANTYTYAQTKLEPMQAPELAKELSAKFGASIDYAKGTLVGELVASPGVYVPYDHTGADGSQVLKGILIYHIVTDADSKITSIGGPVFGLVSNAPIYIGGYFACEDVANPTELDDAIAAFYCKLIQGTSTTGVFKLL